MKEARNETASTRQPNVFGSPGYIGKNSPFKGYPSNYNCRKQVGFPKDTKYMIKILKI